MPEVSDVHEVSDVRKAIATVELKSGLGLKDGEVQLGYGVDLADAGHRIMAFYLHDFEMTKAYQSGGYASIVQYGKQRWDLNRRRTRELVRIGGRLRELPRIDDALCQRKIGWSKVVELCKVAVPEYEEAWLEIAQSLSCMELSTEVKLASAGGKPRDRKDRKGLPEVRYDLHYKVAATLREQLDMARDKLSEERGELVSETELLEVMADLFLGSEADGTVAGRSKTLASQYVIVLSPDEQTGDLLMTGEQGKVPISQIEQGCAICDGHVVALHDSAGAPGGPSTWPAGTSGASHNGTSHDGTSCNGTSCNGSASMGRTLGGNSDGGSSVGSSSDEEGSELDLRGLTGHLSPAQAAILDQATPPWLRVKVLARDGHRCRCCGSHRQVQVHHIWYRQHGGRTVAYNLISLCARCHALTHAGLLILQGKHEKEIVFANGEGEPLHDPGRRVPRDALVEMRRVFARRYGGEIGIEAGSEAGAQAGVQAHVETGVETAVETGGEAGSQASQKLDRGLGADARESATGMASTEDPSEGRPSEGHPSAGHPTAGSSVVRLDEIPDEIDSAWWGRHEELITMRKGQGLEFREGFARELDGLTKSDFDRSSAARDSAARDSEARDSAVGAAAAQGAGGLVDVEEMSSWDSGSLDVIGREDVVGRLCREALGCRNRGKAFPHMLLAGPPGTGKTTLAVAVARRQGARTHRVMGTLIQDVPALLRLVTGLGEGDCLVIDEIHAVPAADGAGLSRGDGARRDRTAPRAHGIRGVHGQGSSGRPQSLGPSIEPAAGFTARLTAGFTARHGRCRWRLPGDGRPLQGFGRLGFGRLGFGRLGFG